MAGIARRARACSGVGVAMTAAFFVGSVMALYLAADAQYRRLLSFCTSTIASCDQIALIHASDSHPSRSYAKSDCRY